MAMNKRGVFFSMIAILLVGTLIYSINIYQGYKLRERSAIIESRINAMNNFLIDIDNDIERGLYISGYRALFNTINYITEIRGDYIGDANETFCELLLNGTYLGNHSNGGFMFNNTFMNWSERMVAQADAMDMDLKITINNVRLFQENPWKVSVEINASISLIDHRNTANWTTHKLVDAEISILDFEDPVYAIETSGDVSNYFRRTNNTDFVDDDNNTGVLNEHNKQMYYVNNSLAPSFLKRLEGDFSSDPNGIESLVYLPDIWTEGIKLYNKSVIDYIYFEDSYPEDSDNFIKDMPNWFKIDDNHLDLYEVSGLVE